ncbi:MAG: YlxR family protein [Lachnospiraceae bacterium]|nr:YlxR family protein [Lachnospiraceae bacterium]
MPSTKKIPMRQCTGCRQMKDKRTMLRVLKTPEGEILPDLTGKQNGRGAYLCRNTECLNMARKHGGLEKSLKTQIPDEVYEKLTKELE